MFAELKSVLIPLAGRWWVSRCKLSRCQTINLILQYFLLKVVFNRRYRCRFSKVVVEVNNINDTNNRRDADKERNVRSHYPKTVVSKRHGKQLKDTTSVEKEHVERIELAHEIGLEKTNVLYTKKWGRNMKWCDRHQNSCARAACAEMCIYKHQQTIRVASLNVYALVYITQLWIEI